MQGSCFYVSFLSRNQPTVFGCLPTQRSEPLGFLLEMGKQFSEKRSVPSLPTCTRGLIHSQHRENPCGLQELPTPTVSTLFAKTSCAGLSNVTLTASFRPLVSLLAIFISSIHICVSCLKCWTLESNVLETKMSFRGPALLKVCL